MDTWLTAEALRRRRRDLEKKTEQDLMDKIEMLEDALGSGAYSDDLMLLGLTRKQREILGMIIKRERVTRDQIMTVVWGNNPVDTLTIDVHVCAIRKVLKAKLGIGIETIYNYGFTMTAADKLTLRKYIECA